MSSRITLLETGVLVRTATKSRSQASPSKWKKEIVITIEEAECLLECDVDTLKKLELLLIHTGFRKKEES